MLDEDGFIKWRVKRWTKNSPRLFVNGIWYPANYDEANVGGFLLTTPMYEVLKA